MADITVSSPVPPLSEGQRLADIIVAPSKTFADIPRSQSWWLPFLLIVIAAYLLTAAIQQKVGWSQLVDNTMRSNPKAEERLAQLSPEQLANQHRVAQSFTMGTFYALPIVDIAAFAFMAVILWPTINFGFGGSATYGQVLAVTVFSAIPGAIKALLAAMLLYLGRSPEEFSAEDMLGSNLGYYISTPGALKTFLTSMDVFSIWTAVLLSLGLAIVARTKRGAGYASVFGWWILMVLVRTGFAALNS